MGLPLSALRATSVPLPRTPIRVSVRWIVFGVLVLAYALLTAGIIYRSPILTLDSSLFDLHLRRHHPDWNPSIYYYVILGQRGPATMVFLPYFAWVAWRRRTTEPLVMLGVALVLLNVSVGVVKIFTGRWGPRHTANVHDIFAGGNIFPSGHVSNTVVLYGLVAWIALRYRKLAVTAAVFLSVTVGLGTVYLDTHWFSDVVGGWIAGALVLLILPTVMPTAQRWADRAVDAVRRRRTVPRQAVPVIATATATAAPSRPAARLAIQRKSTPVTSLARSHKRLATVSSRDRSDDPTRCG